ncbi:ATP-binding cassette domain-containing protein [Polycladidibacter hongkongensis]|uniref:ATP-binding cassette domain-containing protein n=1 Tax=Polycladidibacter hongkongensis TaxID=1647556 RepID=UPI0009E75ACE|nr:ATP-binding cassette domain-containing protein [Pseudovibrio hongkongensis]
MSTPLLELRDIEVRFRHSVAGAAPWAPAAVLKAVDGISLQLGAGETLGIVGESGSGKSTLLRAVTRMQPLHSGQVFWQGRDIHLLSPRDMQKLRAKMQMVFQDPLASLNPRLTAGQIIAEPARTHWPRGRRGDIRRKVAELLERVGLSATMINRYPHEFSGGQCQRIGIARALISEPDLLLCDEPVSALDVSVQAQVVNLLMDLQKERGIAMLFVAHDLAVVRHISQRILVMNHGKMVECGSSAQVIDTPQHAYTKELIASVPIPDPVAEKARLAAHRKLAAHNAA